MAKEKTKEFVVPKSNRIKIAKATIGFNIVGYFFITLIALICLLPFIMIISGSFSKKIVDRNPRVQPVAAGPECFGV